MIALQINRLRLDDELCSIPEHIHTAATRLADAKLAVEAAGNALKLGEAQIGAALRESPARYGLGEKPTVDAIKGAIVMHPETQRLESEHREAQHALDLCWAVMNALNAKRDALQPLVRLFMNDYYSAPEPHAVEQAAAASAKATKAAKQTEVPPVEKPAAPKAAKGSKSAKKQEAKAADQAADRETEETPSKDGW